MNKKAQASEYIGIVILVLVVVTFALFGNVGTAGLFERESYKMVGEYQLHRFLIVSKIFPQITVNRIPIEQLLGVYACYGDDTVDYGAWEVEISKEITEVLDIAIGNGLWSLQISDSTCITSDSITQLQCTLSTDKAYMSHEFMFALPCKPAIERAVLFVVEY
jgi:hypothetical protein